MSFDGVFTHAMVTELNKLLIGGRISKIQQPFNNELVLIIRSNRVNYPLLLSANPTYSRMQITHVDFANPDRPSNFVMSLRKNIDGAIIKEITQVDNDRIVTMTLETKDELGYKVSFKLIIEIMGRYSNIILVNKDNQIVDLIKHVPSSKNRFRVLMPGENYVFPPSSNKKNPFKDFSDLDLIDLRSSFEGLAKDTAEEIKYRMNKSEIKRVAFRDFFNEIDSNISPNVVTKNSKMNFYPIKYSSVDGDVKEFSSLSEMLDDYYREKAQSDRIRSQAENLLSVVNGALKKDKNKLKRLKSDMTKTETMDQFRINGELLTTYMHEVKQGMSSVTLDNYYDNSKITIKINPKLTPNGNAQRYFKTYQKLKKSIIHINEQVAQTQEEIDYLDSVLYQISESRLDNLQEIKAELIAGGYISKKNLPKKRKPNKDMGNKFISTDGSLITVGRNNVQNDQLSLKTAKKSDIWLHVKNIPGSHVIISDNQPSEQTLNEAALLAAFYSKAKNSSKVEVDYVPIKQLKKPNGSKPGFVIYEGQKTLITTPDLQTVEQLKKNYLDS
ncbi:hypothetical protein RD055328_06230 [Companilactobacillus sp. RD055328]|uniref:Rqc2 family fibronectin-binding protein n=1 Tax=Companilactobacillus sp. RD055328 TaxID=2916634 RepID=UPI001FC8A49A|nr:NFACT RNA binding domain-containing protein [Companilactobacillus sp. RD055328]GKQ42700.1 hypothetical protein RD055328_06230 [Companilactobacillus sp. RD055328]